MIGALSLSDKKEPKEEFTEGILFARLGPMLVKYLQNLSAISKGSVILIPSEINVEGKEGLLVRLLITSFKSFHVCFKSLFALSNLLSY